MREIAQLLRNNRCNKSVSTCFLFTGTYDLASGTMKSVQEQYIASAATTTTTKTRKERFYIVRTEEGITIEESFIE